jgi:hypothetical protein
LSITASELISLPSVELLYNSSADCFDDDTSLLFGDQCHELIGAGYSCDTDATILGYDGDGFLLKDFCAMTCKMCYITLAVKVSTAPEASLPRAQEYEATYTIMEHSPEGLVGFRIFGYTDQSGNSGSAVYFPEVVHVDRTPAQVVQASVSIHDGLQRPARAGDIIVATVNFTKPVLGSSLNAALQPGTCFEVGICGAMMPMTVVNVEGNLSSWWSTVFDLELMKAAQSILSKAEADLWLDASTARVDVEFLALSIEYGLLTEIKLSIELHLGGSSTVSYTMRSVSGNVIQNSSYNVVDCAFIVYLACWVGIEFYELWKAWTFPNDKVGSGAEYTSVCHRWVRPQTWWRKCKPSRRQTQLRNLAVKSFLVYATESRSRTKTLEMSLTPDAFRKAIVHGHATRY